MRRSPAVSDTGMSFKGSLLIEEYSNDIKYFCDPEFLLIIRAGRLTKAGWRLYSPASEDSDFTLEALVCNIFADKAVQAS